VAGDLVLLAEGDRVPADLALLQSSNLSVDESMLTGESQPVFKHVGGEAGAALLYAGTLVTQGTASARVAATGERSALGRIGRSLAALGEVIAAWIFHMLSIEVDVEQPGEVFEVDADVRDLVPDRVGVYFVPSPRFLEEVRQLAGLTTNGQR